MLVFRLLKDYINAKALAIVVLAGKVNSKFCNGGHICSPPKECCPLGCCLVFASPGYRPTKSQISETSSSMPNFFLWNHWLFWTLFVLLFLIIMCGCGLWKKRQLFSNRLYRRTSRNEEERSDFDSSGSCYPPPQYNSSFHYAPPPYTEVTSKPDLYPLVISYRTDNGKFRDNSVMVQYFRNYMLHPALGSLSTGNNIDSVNSNYIPHSMQEMDSNYPPSYEESRIGELESLNGASRRGHSNNYLPQGQIFGSDVNRVNAEMPQIIVENIHQSMQKSSLAIKEAPNFKAILPTTFKSTKISKTSAQSLPVTLASKPIKSSKESGGYNHTQLKTFKRVNKSVMLSNSADSISGRSNHQIHQYSSDVILAQPQSYCESNSDLHYDSSDILNNTNHFLHRVNGSYSSEDNLSQPRGSLQDFVSSDGLSHSQFSNLEINNFSTSSEVSSLQGCGSPDSPPQAISPTGEFRNLLEKIQQLPNQREGNKYCESKSFDYLVKQHQSYDVMVSTVEDLSPVDNTTRANEVKEAEEKCLLLNELSQSLTKSKSTNMAVVRPNKLLGKQGFCSRSKTFYSPLCHKSALSLRKNNSLKTSNSAPVTPVANFPSPSSFSLNFMTMQNKSNSKKNLESKLDSKLLLHDEEESNDDLF